jgi:putative ABC transport system permease protein
LLAEKKAQETSSLAWAGVGLIALIIAGVGIANITIASVIERTKEIGLRRANRQLSTQEWICHRYRV